MNCYFSKYEPIFGSWHITGELGSGAEGHLYRISREDALGNVFYSALKTITIPAGGENEFESMIAGGMSRDEAESYFRNILNDSAQEFELLEKLKGNSNIVSYEDHDIFERDDRFGWDILIRLEELTPLVQHSIYNRMDESELIRMASDICCGLEVCRKFGIVHRDIKPENIFISPAGSYKLGDFGIARIIEDTSASLSRKGTYTYMAPEIYWGRPYDHSADLYSLGMVMYQYLNDGRMPFMPQHPDPVGYQDGEKAFTERMAGEKPVPAPRTGSDGLKAVVLKACAYDPAERYADAGEMLNDLKALEDGTSAAAPVTQGKQTVGRQKRIAAAVIGLLVAAAATVYALIPKNIEDIEITGLEDGAEIYIGDELSPEYTIVPDWFKDETITFSTDNADVLSTDKSGRLTAGIPGEAVLTVKARDYTEKVSVKVVPKVTSIDGIEEAISLTTGNTLELIPVLKPEKFASEPVTFTAADEKVATVSAEGSLTAVAPGETELTVSAGGCTFKSKVTVTSPPVVYKSNSTGTKKSSGSKRSSGSNSGSSSGKASKGYFDSGDDETF